MIRRSLPPMAWPAKRRPMGRDRHQRQNRRRCKKLRLKQQAWRAANRVKARQMLTLRMQRTASTVRNNPFQSRCRRTTAAMSRPARARIDLSARPTVPISHLAVSGEFARTPPPSEPRATNGMTLSVAGGPARPRCRVPPSAALATSSMTTTAPSSMTRNEGRSSFYSGDRDAGRAPTYMPFCGALSRNCRSASL